MNKLGICNKCKGVNYKSIISKVQKLDNNIQIDIRCQIFCGIGRTKPFVILNNLPIIAENEDDLLNKINEKITQ